MVPNGDRDNNRNSNGESKTESNRESNRGGNRGSGSESVYNADNAESQAVDKAPGEERGKQDKITSTDLKGKKVDGDPSKEEDKPAAQK